MRTTTVQRWTFATIAAIACAVIPLAPAEAASKSKCVAVGTSLREAIGITAGGAVKAKGHLGGARKTAWYVATPEGAAWAVNTKPSAADFGGLILPVNEAARQVSEVGVDVNPRAPIFGTVSATAPEIRRAIACAT
jgi:hypothetical protein